MAAELAARVLVLSIGQLPRQPGPVARTRSSPRSHAHRSHTSSLWTSQPPRSPTLLFSFPVTLTISCPSYLSRMALGAIFQASASGSVELLILCAAGGYLSSQSLLSPAIAVALSRMIVALFLPCLLFISIVETLYAAAQSPVTSTTPVLLAMPAWALVILLECAAVGTYINRRWLSPGLSRPDRRACVVACVFGNSGQLPILLAGSVCDNFGPLAGDAGCKARATGYCSLYLLVWSSTLWTLGNRYLTGALVEDREERVGGSICAPLSSVTRAASTGSGGVGGGAMSGGGGGGDAGGWKRLSTEDDLATEMTEVDVVDTAAALPGGCDSDGALRTGNPSISADSVDGVAVAVFTSGRPHGAGQPPISRASSTAQSTPESGPTVGLPAPALPVGAVLAPTQSHSQTRGGTHPHLSGPSPSSRQPPGESLFAAVAAALPGLPANVRSTLGSLLTPPFLAIVAALCFSSIPGAGALLVGRTSALHPLALTLELLGGVTIPCGSLLVGSKLWSSRGMLFGRSATGAGGAGGEDAASGGGGEGGLDARSVLAVVVARMLIMPIVGTLTLHLVLAVGLMDRSQVDPLMLTVMAMMAFVRAHRDVGSMCLPGLPARGDCSTLSQRTLRAFAGRRVCVFGEMTLAAAGVREWVADTWHAEVWIFLPCHR